MRRKKKSMKPYVEMTKEELQELRKQLSAQYKEFQGKDLRLDMSRGKPSTEQLDLSMGMMDVLSSDDDLTCDDGTDCRNYGVLDGIKEAKELLADMMEVAPDHIIIYGNSSLNVMYDTVSRSMTHGVMGSTPWCKLDKVKFLCPVPGYDRHFSITEYFGIEMVNVPMTPTGPDMDMVEELVANDDSIKGIWCVPKYSNPQGISYSDDTVRRFARLKPAAKDFRIYWDNAYTIHHLYDRDQDHLIEILAECKRAGNPDMVYKFASTSKVSFPGSGIATIAASQNNLVDIMKQLKIQTIGHDKVNQLRHVRFFEDIHGMVEHMRKHADIMRPKFEAVNQILERELGGLGIGEWTSPKGGYFISFDSLDGCAKAIVARCKKSGLVMTGAGATYPYGKDPRDNNIRIAPSYPPLSDLILAMELFALCVKIVSIDKILKEL
jgi:DNA-binding transcriptional MocR family regulator